MKKFIYIVATALACACTAKTDKVDDAPQPQPVFAKGADVGWLSQLEACLLYTSPSPRDS